jgi:predicted nucleotidyltransferase
LVAAVRQAAAQGVTQAQIAREIGRSQPEVSRLVRFHGTSELALRLRHNRSQLKRLIRRAGGSKLRVFGSVATSTDHDGSDVDLLFTMGKPLSLMQLGGLERDLEAILGVQVDLLPDSALRPDLRDRIVAEAVPL